MTALAPARAGVVLEPAAPLRTLGRPGGTSLALSRPRPGSSRPYAGSPAARTGVEPDVLRSLPLPSTEPDYQDGDPRITMEQPPCPGQGTLTLVSGSFDRTAAMRAAPRTPPDPAPDSTAPTGRTDRSLARPAARMATAPPRGVPARGPILACGSVSPLAPAEPPVPLDEDDDVPLGSRHTPRADLPDPDAWARQLSQILAEVLTGHRPHTQLVRWTTEQVYRHLRQSIAVPAPSANRRRTRPVVGTVRVCEPADGVAEVSAVLRTSGRVRALALRLEGMDGRWVVTALQTG